MKGVGVGGTEVEIGQVDRAEVGVLRDNSVEKTVDCTAVVTH